MKLINESIRSFLKMLWCGLLNILLPNHIKRIFFLTTVYLNMTGLREFKRETLAKLNEALTLADDAGAMELPALFYQLGLVRQEQDLSHYSEEVINRVHPSEEDKRDKERKLEEDEYLQNVCRAVLDVTPKWRLYGRRDDMVKDLFGLFNQLPQMRPSTPYY